MKIIIGADIVPTESNYELFAEGQVENLLDNKLIEILNSADYRIFNLEVPLTDEKNEIPKCGPNLIAPKNAINGIKNIGADLLALANNHIMDQSQKGLFDTISVLKENNIAYVGAGKNLSEAKEPYIIEKDGKKVGVYACAEHEFSIAEENKPGANPIDLLESFDHVYNLKQQCDYVIVLYHGGKELYRYPSPNLQKVCRKLVDKGADLVITQHSHCIGCEENYNDGKIVYGQGNFLFDASDNEFWKTSLLVELNLGEKTEINYIPICKDENRVCIASDEEKTEIIDNFNKRTEEILQDEFVKKKFEMLVASLKQNYIDSIYGVTLIRRIINKLTKNCIKKRITKRKKLAFKNFVSCEAHKEILEHNDFFL